MGPLERHARHPGGGDLAHEPRGHADHRAAVGARLELQAHVRRAERAVRQEAQQQLAAVVVAEPGPQDVAAVEHVELGREALAVAGRVGQLASPRLEQRIEVVGQVRALGVGDDLEEARAALGRAGRRGPERGEVLGGVGEVGGQRGQRMEQRAGALAVAGAGQHDREVVDQLGVEIACDRGAQQLHGLAGLAGLEARDRARVQLGGAHRTSVGPHDAIL
jgi:hypothetical protein